MKNLLKFSSFVAVLAGIVLVIGGLWAICFTYKNVAQENIITPEDSYMPQVPVRGPFSLKAQVDIIRKHTLGITGGKTYSQMPQKIAKLDANGNQVIGVDGQPVMVANTARDIWVTATTLTTALNLAIMTYVFSALIILLGCISIWTGLIYCFLGKKQLK